MKRTLSCAIAIVVTSLGISYAGHLGPPSARVDAVVGPSTDPLNPFLYTFTLDNTSAFEEGGAFNLVNWELPIFGATDIDQSSLMSPFGWDVEVIKPNATTQFYNNPEGAYGDYRWNYSAADDPELDPSAPPPHAADPNLYGPNPGAFENPPLIIHWFDAQFGEFSLSPGQSLGGFSFESPYSQTNAPYLASWIFLPVTQGDPPIPGGLFAFGIPNSPGFQATQQPQQIPEPGTLLLTAFGLLVAWERRYRRC